MNVRRVTFAGSAARPGDPRPADLPHVAFSGRSNVGKSSLINVLLRQPRAKPAHVSSRPGKTRTLNFFRVNDDLYFVDLPGFGYARAPEAARAAWKDLVEAYLSEEEAVRGIVHLVDARHEPTELDRRMVDYVGELGLPAMIVPTKIDKLNRTRRADLVGRAASALEVDPDQVLPFSSRTGEGREELLAALESLLTGGGARR